MDTRLGTEPDIVLPGTDRIDNEHISQHPVGVLGGTYQHDMDLSVMVGGKPIPSNSILDESHTVANGPNVHLYNNEPNRNIQHVINHPWLFVTGGCGYIGSHLAAHLKSSTPYNLMLIDKRAKLLPHTTRYCDVFADEDFISHLMMQAIRDYQPLCMIHLAANSTIGPGMIDPMSYWENNVIKTLGLIQSCIDHNVKNFIFASTSSVYDDVDYAVSESDNCKPVNAYARTKHTIEMALQDCWHSHGIRSISFRFFNAAGNHPFYDLGELNGSSHLISKIMESIVHKTSFNVFGKDYDTPDGTAIRDYTHVMDIVEAISTSIPWLDQNPGAHVINLGAGKGYSVQQIIDNTEQILNTQLSYRYVDRRPGDTAKRFADITKANQLLQWTPKRNLNDIIQDAFKWYNSNMYKDLTYRRIKADL